MEKGMIERWWKRKVKKMNGEMDEKESEMDMESWKK